MVKNAAGIAKIDITIDWSEMDRYGHVNNVMIMKYVQAARVGFWELVGIGSGIDSTGKGANLAATSCNFLSPLFYPGTVHIDTGISFVKNTSFGLVHKLRNADNELVAEARDVVVLFDYQIQNKIPISDDLRAQLVRFLIPEN